MYSRLGNEGLIAILAQPPSSSPTIAILTSDHHGSNFSYNSQVLRRKHPVLGIKLNPLSLLFQLARYHRNNTNKRLQNNGFLTLQRNHMFSVAFVHYAHAGVMAFLEDKTSAPDVFSSCSFIPRAHFETSLVMVSCFGYEI